MRSSQPAATCEPRCHVGLIAAATQHVLQDVSGGWVCASLSELLGRRKRGKGGGVTCRKSNSLLVVGMAAATTEMACRASSWPTCDRIITLA